MAPIVPTSEPIAATAGATWTWTTSSSTYPVSEGWALSYVFAGASTLPWSTGYVTDDGATHTVTIPATVTALLSAGRYEVTRKWTGSATYADRIDLEALAPLAVAVNPLLVAPGDRVTFAEANLAAVEAAITARLAGDQPEEYAIGGRSVRKIDLKELRAMRTSLQSELWKARNPGVVRQHVVRFSVPSA